MRAWTGVALLAVSWLLGLHVFEPARPVWWTASVLAAVLCCGAAGCAPASAGRETARGTRGAAVALVLLLLPTWWLPWPWRAGPLLMAGAALVELAPLAARWPRRLGRGALVAGGALVLQGLALLAYTAHTARSHDLPWWLRDAAGAVARLLGADVAVDGGDLVFRLLGQTHRIGATCELLLDPATLLFFVGGMAVLGMAALSRAAPGERWAAWLRGARVLALAVIAWLPIRLGLVLAVYLDRAMLEGPDAAPLAMGQFFSPWFHLLLLIGPVVLAARFVPWPGEEEAEQREESLLPARGAGDASPVSLALIAAGAALVTAAAVWSPVGRPKEGRVMVVERHSLWEPTTRAYDTRWYGEPSGYNYRVIYDYCGHYYETSQLLEDDAIDDATLASCDVLIIKTPTARYSEDEVRAVGRFVAGGGGLLLIGDHTNVFRSSTYLNDVARPMGFTFRNDLLFCVGSPYEQHYRRPAVPHPAVQHVPWMDFAVSCSIDPGTSWGRAAMRGAGLWSLPSAYHATNYHPHAEYRPEMRYGAFVQLWTCTHGRGRVAAFTDSTIFSNFSIFQPGKAELFLNVVQWLNHTSAADNRWVHGTLILVVVLAGLGLAGAGWWRIGKGIGKGDESNLPHSGKSDSSPSASSLPCACLSPVAAGLFGATLAMAAVSWAQGRAMPPPEPHKPVPLAVIDRTTSEATLSKGAYNESAAGFGLLEQTIPRLGYFTARRSGMEAFEGDVLVALHPTRSVPDDFRQRLVRYVADGGKLLVIDSPVSEGSTANSLLWPFGLNVSHAEIGEGGALTVSGRASGVAAEAACKVSGGETLALLGDVPAAARANHGKGTVVAVGFGHVFADGQMGRDWLSNWMLQPDAQTLARYELFYALFRGLMYGGPVELPRAAPPKPKTPEAPGVPEAPDVPEAPIIKPPPPEPTG